MPTISITIDPETEGAFGVYVPLDYAGKQRLLDLAKKERRTPRSLARGLLERALAEADADASPGG